MRSKCILVISFSLLAVVACAEEQDESACDGFGSLFTACATSADCMPMSHGAGCQLLECLPALSSDGPTRICSYSCEGNYLEPGTPYPVACRAADGGDGKVGRCESNVCVPEAWSAASPECPASAGERCLPSPEHCAQWGDCPAYMCICKGPLSIGERACSSSLGCCDADMAGVCREACRDLGGWDCQRLADCSEAGDSDCCCDCPEGLRWFVGLSEAECAAVCSDC